MSSKVTMQQQQQTQGRRTPLSLSGTVAKNASPAPIDQKSNKESAASKQQLNNEVKKNQQQQNVQQNGEKKNGQGGAVKKNDASQEAAKASKIPVSAEKKVEQNGNEKAHEKPKRNEEPKASSANEDKKNGVATEKTDKATSKTDQKSETTSKQATAKNHENATTASPKPATNAAEAAKSSPAKKAETPTKKSETPTKALGAKGKEKSSPMVVEVPAKAEAGVKSSPIKPTRGSDTGIQSAKPAATSTPGKAKAVKQTPVVVAKKPESPVSGGSAGATSSPDRQHYPRNFSQISGRRSIRPITDYTPSDFKGTKFRESYRRINTELDVTNCSMNATVGSEVPNNSSFSSFLSSLMGSNRKRERTPPTASQSAMEIQTDTTPPKRARLDGLFSAVASPITMLRSRFSKTNLQCSTPNKLRAAEEAADDVQNVSGVSVEEIVNSDKKEITIGEEAKSQTVSSDADVVMSEKEPHKDGKLEMKDEDDVKITETPLTDNKNKRCSVM